MASRLNVVAAAGVNGAHHREVAQRRAEPHDHGADEQPEAHAHRGGRDPSAWVQPAAAGQALSGTDDGTGDHATYQRRHRAVDAASDDGTGNARDGEEQESSGPDQPRSQEGLQT